MGVDVLVAPHPVVDDLGPTCDPVSSTAKVMIAATATNGTNGTNGTVDMGRYVPPVPPRPHPYTSPEIPRKVVDSLFLHFVDGCFSSLFLHSYLFRTCYP